MVTKALSWLGKTVLTVLITVVMTLWLTGLIITSVVQSILEEYEIPLQVEPAIYSGVLSALWGYQQTNEQVKGSSTDKAILGDIEANSEQSDIETPHNVTEPTESSDGDIELDDDSVVEVFAPIELEEKVEISKNELGLTKDSLTESDKERLLQLVVEKIPADQWQIISVYLEDGLSEKELLDTQQILAQYLNDEEYSELMAILKKS